MRTRGKVQQRKGRISRRTDGRYEDDEYEAGRAREYCKYTSRDDGTLHVTDLVLDVKRREEVEGDLREYRVHFVM